MKEISFFRRNLLFLIIIFIFSLILISQYLLFEDEINEKVLSFLGKKVEEFKINEDKAFINQFGFNSLDEILENLPGRIPILEYHIIESPYVFSNYILTKKVIKDKKNSRFFVTSDELRTHLEMLYKNGFRNISLDEYLSLMKGETKQIRRISPGARLYVLTFDDATFGQFDFINDEKGNILIDPDCAVGIMISFARNHPEFKLNAAFCIDFENVPFLQPEYVGKKLNLLLDYGFEIVNHTKNHRSLGKLFKKNPELVNFEIGKAMEFFEAYLGYRVTSINKICYPNGDISPGLPEYIKKIRYNGREYNFVAALDAVGPLALNPNETNFNAYTIKRVEINSNTFIRYVINGRGIYRMPPLVLKNSDTGRVVKANLSTNTYLDLIKLP
ncbi:MAG: hypothetical protein ACP5QT_06385 [Brevinematia bacterium]